MIAKTYIYITYVSDKCISDKILRISRISNREGHSTLEKKY